jgi:hypothetical protein
LDDATHEAIHKWMGAGPWNDVIMSRVLAEEARLPKAGSVLSRRQVMRIGAEMRREAGLSYIKIDRTGS